LCLERNRYSRATAAAALSHLLAERRFAEMSASLGSQVRGENGLGQACDAIDMLLG
jgi:hypothetical protein